MVCLRARVGEYALSTTSSFTRWPWGENHRHCHRRPAAQSTHVFPPRKRRTDVCRGKMGKFPLQEKFIQREEMEEDENNKIKTFRIEIVDNKRLKKNKHKIN